MQFSSNVSTKRWQRWITQVSSTLASIFAYRKRLIDGRHKLRKESGAVRPVSSKKLVTSAKSNLSQRETKGDGIDAFVDIEQMEGWGYEEKERERERGKETQWAWSKTKEQFWSFQSNDNDVQGTVTINGNFDSFSITSLANLPIRAICTLSTLISRVSIYHQTREMLNRPCPHLYVLKII